jgi:hypothetical protein
MTPPLQHRSARDSSKFRVRRRRCTGQVLWHPSSYGHGTSPTPKALSAEAKERQQPAQSQETPARFARLGARATGRVSGLELGSPPRATQRWTSCKRTLAPSAPTFEDVDESTAKDILDEHSFDLDEREYPTSSFMRWHRHPRFEDAAE